MTVIDIGKRSKAPNYVKPVETGVNASIVRKVPKLTFLPTRLQHNDVLILSLRSANKLYITFILYFLVIMFRLRY